MVRWLELILPAAALLSPACGCESIGSYFRNRGGDLSDVIQIAAGGPAFGAHVEALELIAAGLDGWAAYGDQGGCFGNFQSRVPGVEKFAAYSVVLLHARGVDTDPMSHDPFDDAEFPPVDAGTITHALELHRAFSDNPPRHLRLIHWLDVEVDAAFGVGARVRASPGELVDFLLGWARIDLAGDDR